MPTKTKTKPKVRKDELRKILEERRERLWQEIRDDLFGEDVEEYRSQFERAMDDGDKSVADQMAALGLKKVDIVQEELSQLHEAERKLNNGTYGQCEECGSEISAARLAARPFAVYCLPCQEQREGTGVRGRGPTL